MQIALIHTLFRAYSNQKLLEFSKAIVLYEQLEKVEETYLMQLQLSMWNGKMISHVPQSKNWCLLATYEHSAGIVATVGRPEQSHFDYEKSLFAAQSLRLLQTPWVQSELNTTEIFCPWIRRNAKQSKKLSLKLPSEDSFVLIAADGSRFLLNARTVIEKSGKLASALRFAQMNRDEESSGELIELKVAIPADFCKLLIQHMYHGSICYGWPDLDDDDMCGYFLDLMLVAEEFLVPSLVQEIEMRLISSKPKRCFCWDCCQALRRTSSDAGYYKAQCLCMIDGNSRMVNRDTAIDVLSLSEYIGGLDYKIFLAPINMISFNEPRNLWMSFDKENKKSESWKVNKAITSLRDIAIVTILKEFARVVQSPELYRSTEDTLNKESNKQYLLQMCLNELRNNSAIMVAHNSLISKQYVKNEA